MKWRRWTGVGHFGSGSCSREKIARKSTNPKTKQNRFLEGLDEPKKTLRVLLLHREGL
jgi:hypothetical protein